MFEGILEFTIKIVEALALLALVLTSAKSATKILEWLSKV